MDNRLIGKWYKDDEGETLNIFSEPQLRIKMSFTSSGYYNFEPNCVYEKDGYVCYEINDEEYRRVYKVKYEDGFLAGVYTQFGKQTPIKYTRLSELPEDGEFKYLPTNIYVPETDMTRLGVLRKYSAYSSEPTQNSLSYDFTLFEKSPKILGKYNYQQYVNGYTSSDDELAFSLLRFVCDHFKHDGNIGLPMIRRAQDIIKFCEKNGGKTNCRGLAILLASLLRMNGIRAAHITCKPYEEPFCDCHVVVDCLLPSGARVMLDPTYRLYIKDGRGEYISLQKLRRMIIDGEEYFPNEDASYNGGGFNLAEHWEYMTKNTFRFSRGTANCNGIDELRRIELIPCGYPTDKFNEREKAKFVYNDAEFWRISI
jgi:hypothetical protein